MNIRNKLRNIKLFDRLETKYYNITIGIGNIFRWLPIVWKDRDWEYESYTEKFIYRKLKNLYKRNYGEIFEDGEWTQNYIGLCIKLMDEKKKVQNSDGDYETVWKKEKKINHLIYRILETRGGWWWD